MKIWMVKDQQQVLDNRWNWGWNPLLPCKLLCPPHTSLLSNADTFHWWLPRDQWVALFLWVKLEWKESHVTLNPDYLSVITMCTITKTMYIFLLTYTFQWSSLPNPRAATQWDVAAPPAVVSIQTAVRRNTCVIPHHLWVLKEGHRATFS